MDTDPTLCRQRESFTSKINFVAIRSLEKIWKNPRILIEVSAVSNNHSRGRIFEISVGVNNDSLGRNYRMKCHLFACGGSTDPLCYAKLINTTFDKFIDFKVARYTDNI